MNRSKAKKDYKQTRRPMGVYRVKNEFIDFVPILETHNAGDRVFIKSILDAEGITYFIQGETVAPYVFNALPMTLMVKKEQADQAREILKDIKLSYSYGGRSKSV
jgi:hypothetical protein